MASSVVVPDSAAPAVGEKFKVTLHYSVLS